MGYARTFPIASQKSDLRTLLSPHENAIGMYEIQGDRTCGCANALPGIAARHVRQPSLSASRYPWPRRAPTMFAPSPGSAL